MGPRAFPAATPWMTVIFRIRRAATIAAFVALILSACSAVPASPGTPPSSELPAAAPVTDCPDGFLEAYTAAYVAGLDDDPDTDEDVVIVEVDAASFEPAFLAPFLDGGCAIRTTSTITDADGTYSFDADWGFAPEAETSEAIADVLIAMGYTQDAHGAPFFLSEAGVVADFVVGGWDGYVGEAAVEQYFPHGVVFSG